MGRLKAKNITSQSSSPAKGAGLDTAKSAAPLIYNVSGHKRMKYLFIILAIFSTTTYANELYYYSAHPQFMDDKILICDNYVRENADAFKADMNALLKAYTNTNTKKAQTLLKEYNGSILNNTYIKSISDCGGDYKFSNGINYYRELFKEVTMFISTVQNSLNSQTNRADSIQEHHEFTVHYLNIILGSANKTANE